MTSPGQGIHVHPPGLRSAGDRLRSAADQLEGAWSRHLAESRGRGDIFGTDPVGALIGQSYQAAIDIAQTSYGSVIASFAGFGDALRGLADDFEQTDGNNAGEIAGIDRPGVRRPE